MRSSGLLRSQTGYGRLGSWSGSTRTMLLPALLVLLTVMAGTPVRAADLNLLNQTVTTTQTKTTDGTLTAGPSYTINPPGNVTFKAYTAIVLKPGFTAARGAVLRAYLTGTAYDPSLRYFTVTGKAVLNGDGAGDTYLTICGYNTFGRWLCRTVKTDSLGSYSFMVPEGSYTIAEQDDDAVFARGEVNGIVVAGANVAVPQDSTTLVPVDIRLVYFHHDLLGNTVAQTDDQGTTIMRSVFFPFGDQYGIDGQGEKFLFTGKERDLTGLDYFGTRYYDPSIGRFISIDPAGGSGSSPQTWNRYIYCLNNPYKYIDPDGRWPSLTGHFNLSFHAELASGGSLLDALAAGLGAATVDSIVRGTCPYPIIGIQGMHFNMNSAASDTVNDSRMEYSLYYSGIAESYFQKSQKAEGEFGYCDGMRVNDIRAPIYHLFGKFYQGSAEHPPTDIDAHPDEAVDKKEMLGRSYKTHIGNTCNDGTDPDDINSERFDKSKKRLEEMHNRANKARGERSHDNH